MTAACICAPGKIKKRPGEDGLTLQLVRTPDILADVAAHGSRPRLVVGFAAETDDVVRHARDKLERKRIDLIAANRVGIADGGFESDDNALTLIWHDGERVLGPAAKTQLAEELLDLIWERMRVTPDQHQPRIDADQRG